jgi:hypothetical protein
MFAWISRLAVPLAAMAMFALAPPVKAVTVEYFTVGQFSYNGNYFTDDSVNNDTYALPGGGTVTLSNGGIQVDFPNPSNLSPGSATLTFLGVGPTSYDLYTSPPPVFGVFKLTSNDVLFGDNFNGLDIGFELTITQQSDPFGVGGVPATLAGLVTRNPSAAPEGLVVTFEPDNVWIPDAATGYQYIIESPVSVGGNLPSTYNAGTGIRTWDPVSVTGSVSAPLPPHVWSGLLLFGGLSLAKLRRRGKVAQA